METEDLTQPTAPTAVIVPPSTPVTETVEVSTKPVAPPADPLAAPRPVRGLNDTRGPDDAVEGHFVDVVEGEFKGRYGVYTNTTPDGKHAVVRTRDSRTDLFTVPIEHLRPAQAGRR